MTPEGFWRDLPPELQKQAERWLPRWGRIPGMRVLAYSEWEPTGNRLVGEVLDPVWVSRAKSSWKVIENRAESREYEFHMMKNAVATRDMWRWELEPARNAGAAVHVLGNGPSAQDFPGKANEHDLVVAINGARTITRPDFWVLVDSGYIGGPEWVNRMRALAAEDPTVPTIMSPGSPPALAEILRETHWFLGANAPGQWGSRYYRHITPRGRKMPSFISGRQTLVSTLHFAWWLIQGTGSIHLWGTDFGCEQKPRSLNEYYGGAHANGGAELHLVEDWFYIQERFGGPGWSTPDLLTASRAVDGILAFLRDDGVKVYQHRRPGCGVRLVFAETVEDAVEAAA